MSGLRLALKLPIIQPVSDSAISDLI